MVDVAIIGGGSAGLATAARLQAQGLRTLVCEAHGQPSAVRSAGPLLAKLLTLVCKAHGQPGGCAGFFRRRGFAFDVGATTLVDFEPGGVGGELLTALGMEPIAGEALPGYVAWLPDRQVTL